MSDKALTPEELDAKASKYQATKAAYDKLGKEKDALRDEIVETLKVTGEKLTGGSLSQKLPSGTIVLAEHKTRYDEIDNKTVPFLTQKGHIYVEASMNRDEVNGAIKDGRITPAEIEENFKKSEFFQVKVLG